MNLSRAALLTIGLGLLMAAPASANHQTVYGLTTQNPSQIVSFPVGQPGTAMPSTITGLMAGDANLVGIDFRPRGNALYGVSDTGRLYRLAPPAMAGGAFTATNLGTVIDPDDVDSGFDFNPAADRLRLSNVNDQNFRIDVDANVTTTDMALQFAPGDPNAAANPAVGGAAYTNNFDGTAATTLFDIESTTNTLVTQNPPNNGTLNTVGTLPGGDITSVAGFDIETQTGNAYAALQTTGSTASTFYRLNLATGAAMNTFGDIAGGQLIEGVTLAPTALLQFANAVTSVREGDSATVTIARQGAINQTATVNYATELAAGDTATSDDYSTATGTLTFAPGEASKSFSVPTTADSADESDEALTVRLSAPNTAVNLPTPATAKVNIVDDDDAPAAAGVPATPQLLDLPGKPGAAPFGLINVPTQRIDSSLKATFICDENCAADLTLKSGRTLDKRSALQTRPGVNAVNFKLSSSEVRYLKRKARGARSAKLSVSGTFRDSDGSSSRTVSFQLG